MLTALAALAGGAWAQGNESLIAVDVPIAGQQSSFGDWFTDALRGERVRVRRASLDDLGGAESGAACVVTWSEPNRPGGDTKRLRAFVRAGGGIVYVIGEGNRHVNRARAFFGPLDVNVRALDGGAGAAQWAPHPLTEGLSDLGAVTAGSSISGAGASPLIRTGGRPIAVAFDWGPLGRAVIIDHSVLFDQLYEATPRPAAREFLVRAALWAARVGKDADEFAEGPKFDDRPGGEEPPARPPVEGLAWDRALVDLPADSKGTWPALRAVILAELERAGLQTEEPRSREGEPVIDSGALERAGLLVIGSGREGDEVHWSEPLAVGWFFSRGGRILAIPHAASGSMKRMVGFNALLTQLRIAVSLERDNGRAELVLHPITRGIRMPDEGLPVRQGARVWAPLTDPLVTVRRSPAAVAWQLGEGRIVIIDGELLRAQRRQNRPYPEMVELLRNSIRWLQGDL